MEHLKELDQRLYQCNSRPDVIHGFFQESKHTNCEKKFIQIIVECLRSMVCLDVGMKLNRIRFAEWHLAKSG